MARRNQMSATKILLVICGITLLAIPLAFLLSEQGEAPPKENKPPTAVATEDLSACKHPCGTQTIPSPSSPLLNKLKGTAFDFEKKQLTLDPFTRDNKKAGTYANLLKKFRDEKIGDIFFESVEGPYFISLSGRMADLGEHYLHEFDGKEIPRPDICKGVDDNGIGGEGLMPKIKLGHCYALETTGGKMVLIRVVSLRDRAATIQWILDDTGKRILTIPKGKLTEPPPENANVFVMTLKWDPQISENIKENREYCNYAIEQLLKIARDKKAKEDERVAVVKALGEYRSVNALEDLFKLLDSPGKLGQEALATLIKIDKPASLRALTLLKDTKDAGRAETFIKIIVAIEGEKLAKAMLEEQVSKFRRLATRNPEHKNEHETTAKNLTAALELLDKWIKEREEQEKQLEEQNKETPPESPAEPGEKPSETPGD